MNGSFGFKLSENFNIALFSMHTQQIFCLEVLTFKIVIKVSAWKPEVNENATLSMVNVAINETIGYDLTAVVCQFLIDSV